MHFFVLTAALFLTVYTVYASPVGPVPPKPGKAIVDTFAPFVPRDLIPRMDSEGQSSHEPDLNAPDRYLSAYTQDIQSVVDSLIPVTAKKKKVVDTITTEFKEATSGSSEWSLNPLPSGRTVPTKAVQATLEPYGNVWIIATTSYISNEDTYTRRDLYAAMLLMQQNDILGTWAKTKRSKNDGYKYYIVAKVTDRFPDFASLPQRELSLKEKKDMGFPLDLSLSGRKVKH
ncbi:hypothetical protein AX14_005194 [Amanita brunnescens Koide BX004]|nr:hypothetical protein AX14_005194 [Amanita brunnescens Koide BX004]